MIYGIGTDIIDNQRIAQAVKDFGPKFLKKVFTSNEIAYCKNKTNPALYYAARFSAKEAFLKALGTGLDGKISLKDIEVSKDKTGKPFIKQTALIKKIFFENKIAYVHLSISHIKDYSIAYVVLEK